MGKKRLAAGSLVILVLTFLLAGCKDDKKQKALVDEIARAKAETVKFKAETVQLKSEISYLNEKLAAANEARDNLQIQLSQMTKDSNAAITSADNIQQENNKLRKLLAEQLKKNNELEKQAEMLKAAIRELQTKSEPNKILESPPSPTEKPPADN